MAEIFALLAIAFAVLTYALGKAVGITRTRAVMLMVLGAVPVVLTKVVA